MKQFIVFGLLILLAGCSLKRYERKFAKTVVDTVTVRQQVVFNVPKDSAILRIVTDTTHIIREVRQGRATVRIIREPTFTTVFATCDSLRIAKEAIAKIPQKVVQFGVPKFYQYGFYVLLVILGILTAAIWLSRIFTVKIQRK